jgi:hypothetical protein
MKRTLIIGAIVTAICVGLYAICVSLIGGWH